MTWAEKTAKAFCDSIMLCAHGTYNAPRGRRMVKRCIKILTDRVKEIKEKPASPGYYKSRYAKDRKR